ncbi:MAG: agmatinase [SAR324 cluster bacterium]|nr:agmatinase [SAR324 cluster bacterium]
MTRKYRYPEFENPQTRPRYTGIPTFFRTPFQETSKGLDIALVGVPFDGGVTNRVGARHGPREIRNQSSLIRKMNPVSGIDPYDLAKIADVGDAWVEGPFDLEKSHQEIENFFYEIHNSGTLPVSAGGDHSVTLPIFRAIASERPVGMVHFDAHCDTGDDYLGSKFHHGAPFRRAVEEGLLDPKRTVQIGIRGSLNDPDIWKFSHDSGMRVIYIEEFFERGWKAVIDEAKSIVGPDPAYLSFDVDGLDPVYAPGTGTPEIGGFSNLEAQLMIRELGELNLVGGDLVEVAPPFDQSGNTALTGATLMFEILCVVAQSLSRRK